MTMLLNGKPMKNWLKLIRYPNLLIIIFTQYLLGYGIIRPMMLQQHVDPPLGHFNFALLVCITVLIAAAGYIINDAFDVNTDRQNKPGKNMLEEKISSNTAFVVYYVLNGMAILAGFYLAWMAGSFQLGLIFPAIAGLLWFYSSRYQRTLFWGNLIVAFLSALVVLIVWLFEFVMLMKNTDDFVSVINQLEAINIYIWAYALFAFLVSLIREILKDVQDLKGDTASAYRTVPVVWGGKVSRFLAASLTFIVIGFLAIAQWYLYSKGMELPFWYLLVAVQSILVYLLFIIFSTKDSEAYAFPATTAKIIMVAGILSMELIYISF
jgi:4-hydroxybenzoate polyprenyltransferase